MVLILIDLIVKKYILYTEQVIINNSGNIIFKVKKE